VGTAEDAVAAMTEAAAMAPARKEKAEVAAGAPEPQALEEAVATARG
jgi:hypothetical protein